MTTEQTNQICFRIGHITASPENLMCLRCKKWVDKKK